MRAAPGAAGAHLPAPRRGTAGATKAERQRQSPSLQRRDLGEGAPRAPERGISPPAGEPARRTRGRGGRRSFVFRRPQRHGGPGRAEQGGRAQPSLHVHAWAARRGGRGAGAGEALPEQLMPFPLPPPWHSEPGKG